MDDNSITDSSVTDKDFNRIKSLLDMYDSDEEQEIEMDKTDKSKFHERFLICEKCGADNLLKDDLIFCSNNDCGMISNDGIEELNNIKNSMPLSKRISNDQRKQVYKELNIMNKNANNTNILQMTDQVINKAVDIFSQLGECRPETRNKKRIQLLATCIYLASLWCGQFRTKKDIQKLSSLTDRNITTTISDVQMEINKRNLSRDICSDMRSSFTNSICIKINIPIDNIPKIIEDVIYTSDIISDNMLVSSNFESKILASIFIGVSIQGFSINIGQICKISSINQETVKKIVQICYDNMELFIRFTERTEEVENIILKENNYMNVLKKDIINYMTRYPK